VGCGKRLDDIIDAPQELLRTQLRWAVDHDFLDRVRLLVQHGADYLSAYEDGRTPVELAALAGNTAIVDYLASQGAASPDLDPGSALIAAAFRADSVAVQRLAADRPGLPDEVRRLRPGLMVWAAANGRTDTVRLLLGLGFDVNAKGRGDTPIEGPSQTPLHEAAVQGNLELARLLLANGADPNIRDLSHDASPLGWAQYGGQDAMIELLAPLTDEHASSAGTPQNADD
jgi:ankyrin repeat protein